MHITTIGIPFYAHQNYKDILQDLKRVENLSHTMRKKINTKTPDSMNTHFKFLIALNVTALLSVAATSVSLLFAPEWTNLIFIVGLALTILLYFTTNFTRRESDKVKTAVNQLADEMSELFEPIEAQYPLLKFFVDADENGAWISLKTNQRIGDNTEWLRPISLRESGNEEQFARLMELSTQTIQPSRDHIPIMVVSELDNFKDARVEWIHVERD